MFDYYNNEKFINDIENVILNAKNSKFYSARLNNIEPDINILNNIKPTEKEDLRNALPEDLLVNDFSDKLYAYHESFGTTGKPVATWLSKNDFENYVAQIEESEVVFDKNTRALIRFPYAISVPAHIFSKAIRNNNGCVIAASSRTFVSPHKRIIELLIKLKVTVLCCMPLEAIFLAETARLLGYDPQKDFPDLRSICTAGELLVNSRRKRIEEIWNVEVFNFYGTTETGNLATTCSSGKLHASDAFIFEVLDENLNHVDYGQIGELYVTTLRKEAFPLLRYKVGDMVSIEKSENLCDKEGLIINHFGRDQDIIKINNESTYLTEIQNCILAIPREYIGDFWIILYNENSVCIKFETRHSDLSKFEELKTKISKELNLPVEFILEKEGTLFNRDRLLNINPVIKPKYIMECSREKWEKISFNDLLSGYHTFKNN